MADIRKMEAEMESQLVGMQHKALERRFENNANLNWPTASLEKNQTILPKMTDDEPELLVDEESMEKTTAGGPDDLQALNYVTSVTDDSYTERKQIDPIVNERKEREDVHHDDDDDDEENDLLPGMFSPGATIAEIPADHVTPVCVCILPFTPKHEISLLKNIF